MIRQQREEDFDWVLSSIKKHVGDRAWASVTTVAMDGDQAMKNAVTRHLPYRFMARCIWHIEQNILTNISKFGTAGIDDSVKTELHASIKQLIYTTSRSQFELDKAKLDTQLQSKSGNAALDKFRLSVYQYLTTNTWPNVEAFAAWSVNNQLTFGAHTTQRSESLHSLLKRQSRNGKKVSISTTALELFTFLHNTAHNHCIGGANKDYRYHQQTKTNIDAYTSIQRETITDLTLYASNEVVKQFGSLNSWKAQQSGTRTLTTIGPLTTVIEWNVKHHSQPDLSHTVLTDHRDPVKILQCSCGMPGNLLLPCVHVMSVNHTNKDSKAFLLSQVGTHWHRAHDPPPNTRLAADYRDGSASVLVVQDHFEGHS